MHLYWICQAELSLGAWVCPQVHRLQPSWQSALYYAWSIACLLAYVRRSYVESGCEYWMKIKDTGLSCSHSSLTFIFFNVLLTPASLIFASSYPAALTSSATYLLYLLCRLPTWTKESKLQSINWTATLFGLKKSILPGCVVNNVCKVIYLFPWLNTHMIWELKTTRTSSKHEDCLDCDWAVGVVFIFTVLWLYLLVIL